MKEYIIEAYMESNTGSAAMGRTVAELIRCNSCAHYNESPVMLGYCIKWGLYTEEDGFCYKAEQAENAK
jgi:hypothetical protein